MSFEQFRSVASFKLWPLRGRQGPASYSLSGHSQNYVASYELLGVYSFWPVGFRVLFLELIGQIGLIFTSPSVNNNFYCII